MPGLLGMSENHFFSMSRHCRRQGKKLFTCIFGHQTPIVVVEIAVMIVPPRWLWDVLVFQGRLCCSRHQNGTFCASIRFEITPNVHHHLYCCSQKRGLFHVVDTDFETDFEASFGS